MNRKKRALLTSSVSIVNQFVTILCGFILPRFYLRYYGSSINGLISSITQFLSFISLAELGVGAVVRSNLYKPLSVKNEVEISKLVLSSERFFKKLAYLLIIYASVLTIIYPSISSSPYDYFYTASLIVIISISTFAQYYVGMTYRILLAADQHGYINIGLHCITLIVNTIICIGLMKAGYPIHIVKFISSLIFVIQPFVISFYAKRKYTIDRSIVLEGEPIKQKWNGLAQHLASVILGNTDTVVLTIFSTLLNVSIYAVYHMIVNGIKNIVDSTTNGMQALMGDMIARNELKQLNNAFDSLEWLIHFLTTLVYSIAAITMIPFVQIYTKGISDANYIQPLFGLIMIMAQATYCFRLPYSILILSSGHFKQTQFSAIFEALINIVISVATVIRYGLIGVAIGTLVAMSYRCIYLVWYFSKNVIFRRVWEFYKKIVIDMITIVLIYLIYSMFPKYFYIDGLNYISWLKLAVKTSVCCFAISLLINLLFNKHYTVNFFTKLGKRIKKLKLS